MRIRPAEIDDAQQIAGVHVRSWQAAYRGRIPQDYLDRMDPAERLPIWKSTLAEMSWPRQGILVAEIDGGIAGFAGLCPTRDEDEDPEKVGEVAAIYLAPQSWGTGAGRRLMAAAVDVLTQAGYEEATLWVLDTNERARRFYQAAGWRPDGAAKEDTRSGFTMNEVRYRRTIAGRTAGGA